MRVNKNIELGLKAVTALKDRTGPTRNEDLANEIGININFVNQVMCSLRLAGIVNVKRGPGGGAVINPLFGFGKITAFDVTKALGYFSNGVDVGDVSPGNLLRISIADAYRNVTL